MADPGGPPPTVALAPTPADDVTILEAAIAAPVLGLGGAEEAGGYKGYGLTFLGKSSSGRQKL